MQQANTQLRHGQAKKMTVMPAKAGIQALHPPTMPETAASTTTQSTLSRH